MLTVKVEIGGEIVNVQVEDGTTISDLMESRGYKGSVTLNNKRTYSLETTLRDGDHLFFAPKSGVQGS